MKQLAALGLLFFSGTFLSQAVEFPQRVESEYFSIYYQSGVDLFEVAYRINIGGPLYIYRDESKLIVEAESFQDLLAQNVDLLFQEVSDILDMHLYSFYGELKICRNQEQLQRIFSEISGGELKSQSFYDSASNTIYISQEGLRPGILAHEIAHAIISHFFVVEPPQKVQEVLAGFVEYHINKKAQNSGQRGK